MSKTKIEQTLVEALAPTYLNVIDDSAKHAGHAGAKEGGHYTIEITSPAFKNKPLLECHRLIYTTLTPLKPTIHALAIKIIK